MEKINDSLPTTEQVSKYFFHLGWNNRNALKLHKEFGLWERVENTKGWKNVSQHCLVEAARIDVLADLLGFPGDLKEDAITAAVLHDYFKKREKESATDGSKEYFDYAERESKQILSERGFSQRVIYLTSAAGTNESILYEAPRLLQKTEVSMDDTAYLALHYIDDFTLGDSWVSPCKTGADGTVVNAFDKRMDYVDRTYPNLKVINEKQRIIGHQIEERLALLLSDRLDSFIEPKQLPELIDKEITDRILAMSRERLNANENISESEQLIINSLRRCFSHVQALGEKGKEQMPVNDFGETPLRADYEAEEQILDECTKQNKSFRVISEEHGEISIGENPQQLLIVDGIDGTTALKRGDGSFGTMCAIFDGTDPTYNDYLVSGILEYPSGNIYIASKGQGAYIIDGNGNKTKIQIAKTDNFDPGKTRVYIDGGFPGTLEPFQEKLSKLENGYIGYVGDPPSWGPDSIFLRDISQGKVPILLMFTGKKNLEIASAFGLITEAGGVVITGNGNTIDHEKYFEFERQKHLPLIVAANRELAHQFMKYLTFT